MNGQTLEELVVDQSLLYSGAGLDVSTIVFKSGLVRMVNGTADPIPMRRTYYIGMVLSDCRTIAEEGG